LLTVSLDGGSGNDYYFNKHLPLAKTLPGLRSYEVTQGDVMGVAGKHGAYLVAAADLANFAGAGVDLMMAETRLA
jgi:uncharacterized protein (TIGR02118 family)